MSYDIHNSRHDTLYTIVIVVVKHPRRDQTSADPNDGLFLDFQEICLPSPETTAPLGLSVVLNHHTFKPLSISPLRVEPVGWGWRLRNLQMLPPKLGRRHHGPPSWPAIMARHHGPPSCPAIMARSHNHNTCCPSAAFAAHCVGARGAWPRPRLRCGRHCRSIYRSHSEAIARP